MFESCDEQVCSNQSSASSDSAILFSRGSRLALALIEGFNL